MIFPSNVGCTSIVIEKDKALFYNRGDRMHYFIDDIDNSISVKEVRSVLIAPIKDSGNQLRGVLQLINKRDGLLISEQDAIELRQLTEVLGDIFKTAENVKNTQNIC